MLKSPDWHLLIVWYFFLGGIAGGAYFTAAIADNFGGSRDRGVVRTGYILSLLMIGVCGILLILDLGTPSRFLNMMMHFKFWDPMSIGAWMLGVFGFFLASYTGVLLSATALPFWSDARLMGALFLASGASTGMAAISLLLYLTGDSAGEGFKKVKRADRFAIVFEMAVLVLFLVLLGSAGAPLTSGHLAPLFWGGLVVLGLVIPLLVDVLGARWVPAVIPAVLVLVGGFILRYVVVMTHA
ncbi:MAG TPA: NrfD/PsrC family molybdoenzyme membrane anchor subunit [Candidatus Dormibacteraeota bacterium]|nr:NrfD/PsrC family molybdoenzyme membrane anchor subunit [Candidatus Dormibacteraeota bacterium]